jgi:hypothetical protein
MTELNWQGKHTPDGRKTAPVRLALPFQTIETVNESVAQRQSLFSAPAAQTQWRNRLIWGDKKYVLPSLLPELAGKVNLIYIDPPFDTGANYPDFVARLTDGSHWLLETKGREDIEVRLKDNAALNWCDAATNLTGVSWQYLKVLQKDFENLKPDSFADLQMALVPPMLF